MKCECTITAWLQLCEQPTIARDLKQGQTPPRRVVDVVERKRASIRREGIKSGMRRKALTWELTGAASGFRSDSHIVGVRRTGAISSWRGKSALIGGRSLLLHCQI